jgi:hypothetical protein
MVDQKAIIARPSTVIHNTRSEKAHNEKRMEIMKNNLLERIFPPLRKIKMPNNKADIAVGI